MKKLFTLLLLLITSTIFAQRDGEFRTNGNASFSSATNWQMYFKGNWITAPIAPQSAYQLITIRSGHTATLNESGLTIPQLLISAGGQLTVNPIIMWTLANGPGADLVIEGTLLNRGSTWTCNGTWQVANGGTFIQNTITSSSAAFDKGVFQTGSNIIFRGSTGTNTSILAPGRIYYNMTIEAGTGTWAAPPLIGGSELQVNGNFTIAANTTVSNQMTAPNIFAGNFTVNGTLNNSSNTQIYRFTGSGKTIGGSGTMAFERMYVVDTASVSLGKNISINGGNAVTIDGTLNLAGFNITASNSLLTGSGKIIVSGNLSTQVSGFSAFTGSYELTGTSQSIPEGDYGSLIINGTGTTLAGNAVISGALNLTSGSLTIGANNLSVGSITGASDTRFIITNGAGALTINNVQGSVLSPVGTSAVRYNPVILNNTGTTDNFTVSVQNTIDNPTFDDNLTVQKQWNISELVDGGSSVLLTFQWNSSDENVAFNRDAMEVGHFTGGAYMPIGQGGAAGSDPYSFTTSSPVTTFSPFVIGNIGIAPVELSAFTAVINGSNVKLHWSTVNEQNNSGFDIERKNVNSTNGDWSTIGNIQGNGTSNVTNSYSFDDRNLSTGNYNYRLKQIDFNGNYEYFNLANEVIVGVPGKFNLSQNYPNPFNPSTSINYELPITNYVTLSVYDMAGKEVMQLVNENKTAGFYTVKFDASKLSSGTYFYRINAGDFSSIKKMMLIK